jgi:hypothetical protein
VRPVHGYARARSGQQREARRSARRVHSFDLQNQVVSHKATEVTWQRPSRQAPTRRCKKGLTPDPRPRTSKIQQRNARLRCRFLRLSPAGLSSHLAYPKWEVVSTVHAPSGPCMWPLKIGMCSQRAQNSECTVQNLHPTPTKGNVTRDSRPTWATATGGPGGL